MDVSLRSHRVDMLFKNLWRLKYWLLAGLAAGCAIAAHSQIPWAELQSGWDWIMRFSTIHPLVFIGFFNLATIVCVPAALLAIQAGFSFGLAWGVIYVLLAAIAGATVAFLLGRTVARQWVSQKVDSNPKFQAIATAVAREGWKIVLLTRLSPVFPFNLTNYAFGVTPISLGQYILGSLGILPGTILYTSIGAIAHDIQLSRSMTTELPLGMQVFQWGLRFLGLASTIWITLYVHRVAKQSLQQHLVQTTERSEPVSVTAGHS